MTERPSGGAMLFDQHEFVVIGEGDDRDHAGCVRPGDVLPAVAFDEIEESSGMPGLEWLGHEGMMTNPAVVVEVIAPLESEPHEHQ